jgi:hypothetical protein
MLKTHCYRILTFALATLLATPVAQAQETDVVIEWNRLLQTTIATPGALAPTIFFTRPYALLHVAIFDALNAVERRYRGYASEPNAPGARRDVAAAQAAHDVMVAMFPAQRATFDTALAATLARASSGDASEGIRAGQAAAASVLQLRADDGWSRVPPAFQPPNVAGFWEPTPPAAAPAAFAHYPEVTGFVVANGRRFLMAPPPTLGDESYARDFNEVKALGAANSTVRTAEQTLIARLWAVIGTTTSQPAVWNNLIADLARTRGLNGTDTARLYALVNMAVHDGLLTTFNGKYLYGLWRPVTAIRNAGRDGNAATDADPGWASLIGNPPYPTYPGNVACIGAVSARVLERFFGRNDIAFSVTWAAAEGPGTTRRYNGFRELADEGARSRIYGGIHFTFDTLASFGVCTDLADYVFENALRPVR